MIARRKGPEIRFSHELRCRFDHKARAAVRAVLTPPSRDRARLDHRDGRHVRRGAGCNHGEKRRPLARARNTGGGRAVAVRAGSGVADRRHARALFHQSARCRRARRRQCELSQGLRPAGHQGPARLVLVRHHSGHAPQPGGSRPGDAIDRANSRSGKSLARSIHHRAHRTRRFGSAVPGATRRRHLWLSAAADDGLFRRLCRYYRGWPYVRRVYQQRLLLGRRKVSDPRRRPGAASLKRAMHRTGVARQPHGSAQDILTRTGVVESSGSLDRTRFPEALPRRGFFSAGETAQAYAALRRPARKVSTLLNSAVACWLSSPDATMTLSASARDWSAAWLAPATLSETSPVPVAACCTLRAISRVAEPCSSTAEAMVVATPLISRMVSLMPPIAVAQSAVADCMAVTCPAISSVAFAVWLASSLTSDATTAKPLPASPARAASMVALSARRLVWLAIAPIRRSTSPIFSAAEARLLTISVVFAALTTASSATPLENVTCRPISLTEEASSSVAVATVPTLAEACSEAAAAAAARCEFR